MGIDNSEKPNSEVIIQREDGSFLKVIGAISIGVAGAITAATSVGCGGNVIVEGNSVAMDAGSDSDSEPLDSALPDAELPDSDSPDTVVHDAPNCDFFRISESEYSSSALLVPRGASNVFWTCWKFENGCKERAVERVTLDKLGTGPSVDLNGFILADHVGNFIAGPTDFGDSNEIELSDYFTIEPNSTTHVCSHVSIDDNAQVGGTHILSLESADSIQVDPKVEIKGKFPLSGNWIEVANVNVGHSRVEKAGQLLPISFGQKQALVAQLRMYTYGEDGELSDFTLSYPGTCKVADMSNFELFVDTQPASIDFSYVINSPDNITISLGEPMLIEKGDPRTFRINADLECLPDTVLVSCIPDEQSVSMLGMTLGYKMSLINDHDCQDNYHQAKVQ